MTTLPEIYKTSLPQLQVITDALGVPRTVLASDDEISSAWSQLPRHLVKIPDNQRTELIVRMCVAIANGLFDSAINYIWNSAIIVLKNKIKNFGLPIVSQILGKTFDEKALDDLRDSELLSLCLQLNLLNEEGFFYLDQCRDIRNNFSAAHPAIGDIDDTELISFLNRCVKYAIGDSSNPKGVDVSSLILSVKGNRFTDDQLNGWITLIRATHDAQRVLIFNMLHGIYCDPSSAENIRQNALDICKNVNLTFTAETISELINRHNEYRIKGETDRHTASQIFFKELNLIPLLNDAEIHAIISKAVRRLYNVHQDWNNFYNEPPFAESLYDLILQTRIPETTLTEFVVTVVTCFVGNQYGISRSAIGYYTAMIKSFSPKAISIMLKIPDSNTIVGQRIRIHSNCRTKYIMAIDLLDPNSISESLKTSYNKWASNKIK